MDDDRSSILQNCANVLRYCKYCGISLRKRSSLRSLRDLRRTPHAVCEECQHKLDVEEYIRNYNEEQKRLLIVKEVETEVKRLERKDITAKHSGKRRALIKTSYSNYEESYVKYLLIKQKYKCIACLTDIFSDYHVDHIYPLSKGGGNGEDNIQLLCPTCNLKKNAKDPIQFLQKFKLRTYCEI